MALGNIKALKRIVQLHASHDPAFNIAVGRFPAGAALSFSLPIGIIGQIARNRYDPCLRPGSGPISMRFFIYAYERVVQHVFGGLPILHDSNCDGINDVAVLLVYNTKRLDIPACDCLERLLDIHGSASFAPITFGEPKMLEGAASVPLPIKAF